LRYDTILLDADGTLLDFARSEREALKDALRQIGVEPKEEMTDVYSEINDGLWKKLERGEIQKSVLAYHRFELLFERYGIDYDARAMAKRYMDNLAGKGYVLEGAVEFCQALAEHARLYIVTNGTEYIQRGRLGDSGLLPYIRDVFISDRIGYPKPKVEYFAYVAEHIPDFDKEKTLIVGDSLTSDMAGGIAYGIDTCWYNPQGKPVPEDLKGRLTMVAGDFAEMERLITEGVAV